MTIPAGTALGPYDVGALLGAGGMGEVYRAVDRRLDRTVALKILPVEFSAAPDSRQRFEREARTLSTFSHPHICRIYDVGQHDGLHYIVMEFLEGETLEARLTRGPLPVAEALRYATDIGDALDQAHRHGVVHRDLKPGNIMLTGAGAVLFDFGLATQWPGGDEPSDVPATHRHALTAEGTLIGTAPYMAPEQLAGHDADAGVDLFAFGAVLYEMLTNRRAFDGNSRAEIVAAVMTSNPPRLSELCPGVPRALDHLVERCLAKSPDERWQTARDVVSELRWIAEPPAAGGSAAHTMRLGWTRPRVAVAAVIALVLLATGAFGWASRRDTINSIAILPFHNVGNDPDMDYLSAGLTESVIRSLSPLRSIKVMSGASVNRYRGQKADPRAVAQLLHVRAVLVGGVSRQAGTLSINIELVDGRDNRQIWGEHYVRPVDGIFAVHEEIAKEIADKLRVRLSGEDGRRLAKRFTESTDAYELYLKGRYYWNRRTPQDLKRSLGFFTDAIRKDPNYALAYVGLADAYDLLGSAGYDVLPPLDVIPKAKAAAAEALRLDDQLAEAHAAMGFVLRFEWNRAAAGREHLRSVQLDPNYVTGRQWLASHYWTEGRFAEALDQLRQAGTLDPLSPVVAMNLGRHFYYARDYDRAEEALRQALALDRGNLIAGQLLALVYCARGDRSAALAQLQQSPAPPGAWLGVAGYVRGVSGDTTGAHKILAELDALSKRRYIPAYAFATVHAGLGDTAQALHFLDRAADERSAYVDYLNVEPTLDGLRRDPRFSQLLRRVNLPVVPSAKPHDDARPSS